MRFVLIPFLFAISSLSACADRLGSEPQYCLGPERDGIHRYLLENADEVADGILSDSLLVVRDYRSEKFRILRITPACAQGEEIHTYAEMQEMISTNARSVTYPASISQCTATATGFDQHSASRLFNYLAMSGLGGVSQTTVEDFDPRTNEPRGSTTSITAVGDCRAVDSMVQALVARRNDFPSR